MSKKKEEVTLKDETCSYPGFEESNNFYDFIYQHRDSKNLLKAAESLIASDPALRLSRLKFVFICAEDPHVREKSFTEMLKIPGVNKYKHEIELLTQSLKPQPAGMD
ncbi:MAG: hypothetical protein KA155_02020 [Alphaproteobacteria bacterium]|jgi:hypothetical protein|nr:hypothetical protein [Alphaproteobacteria bacterium]